MTQVQQQRSYNIIHEICESKEPDETSIPPAITLPTQTYNKCYSISALMFLNKVPPTFSEPNNNSLTMLLVDCLPVPMCYKIAKSSVSITMDKDDISGQVMLHSYNTTYLLVCVRYITRPYLFIKQPRNSRVQMRTVTSGQCLYLQPLIQSYCKNPMDTISYKHPES